jgi:hypothetical protein
MKTAVALVFTILAVGISHASDQKILPPPSLQGIGIDQRLNARVPLDT